MPQYFQVFRCYKCSVFQVLQVKKSNKFDCKLCGEKQSIKRRYGFGTGKECRLHVQKLNGIRGDMDNLKNSLSSDEENVEEIENIDTKDQVFNLKRKSKWSEYVEESEVCLEESINQDMHLGESEVVLERPAKQRKFTRNNKRYNERGSFYKHRDSEESLSESAIEDSIKIQNPVDTLNGSMKLVSEIETYAIKKTVPKKFVPPTCTKNSKWAQFTDETNENIPVNYKPDDGLEKETFLTKNTCLGTKSNVCEKNAFTSQRNETPTKFTKWDFHEKTDKPNKIIPAFTVPQPSSKSKNRTQSNNLFSLCNDNDLDNILDI